MNKKKITILGGGRIARAIIYDLKDEFDVTVVDVDTANLFCLKDEYKNISTITANCTNDMESILEGTDLVVSTLPGYVGYEAIRAVIECGVDVVDISFFPMDKSSLRDLEGLTLENDSIAIIDAGVAPGLSNMMAGYGYAKFKEKIHSVEIKVGGLPLKPNNVFNYKAAWSPIDVIEEYTRPAKFVRDGSTITCDALSGINNIELAGLELEEFYTDGLRSLANTLPIPYMTEKTLRYRGHAEQMKFLRDAGFFNKENIEFTSNILFPQWKFEPGEKDITVMSVEVKNDARKGLKWNLYDEMDLDTYLSSMARCTGFTASLIARYVLSHRCEMYGLVCPEEIGQDIEIMDNFFIPELQKRGISIIKTTS